MTITKRNEKQLSSQKEMKTIIKNNKDHKKMISLVATLALRS
jgi:hypothetical protein